MKNKNKPLRLIPGIEIGISLYLILNKAETREMRSLTTHVTKFNQICGKKPSGKGEGKVTSYITINYVCGFNLSLPPVW